MFCYRFGIISNLGNRLFPVRGWSAWTFCSSEMPVFSYWNDLIFDGPYHLLLKCLASQEPQYDFWQCFSVRLILQLHSWLLWQSALWNSADEVIDHDGHIDFLLNLILLAGMNLFTMQYVFQISKGHFNIPSKMIKFLDLISIKLFLTQIGQQVFHRFYRFSIRLILAFDLDNNQSVWKKQCWILRCNQLYWISNYIFVEIRSVSCGRFLGTDQDPAGFMVQRLIKSLPRIKQRM